MASKITLKKQFDLVNNFYQLNLKWRAYKPGNNIRYQILDADNNPITEHILATQMQFFLKGLSEGLKISK